MKLTLNSEQETRDFGVQIGKLLSGGEVIELIGDVGAGKTSLTKGIAIGLDVDDDVQSPSFTISRLYQARAGLQLAHYDFYRLTDAGIMADELAEAMSQIRTVTIIEWSDVVKGVLPVDRLTVQFESPSETSRTLSLETGGPNSQALVAQL